jgi:hypothetical protein
MMMQKTINLSDSDSVIYKDLRIEENETLIIKNATIRFSSEAGIFCLGQIEAENCIFIAADPTKGWKGIADIGTEHSTFIRCRFSGGRGRTLGEIKDHYISRYFTEIENLEMLKPWRREPLENPNTFYDDGTYGGALITLLSSIDDCTFDECKVTRDGGAVLATHGVSIIRCRFERCQAGNGGGVSFNANNSTIIESIFISCSASSDGGGIVSSGATIVSRCHFVQCIANRGGGVVGYEKLSIHDSLFRKCNATFTGGGIYGTIYGSRLLFDRCVSRNGGGASFEEATRLKTSTFYRCQANNDGGGLWMNDRNMGLIEECRFMRCYAENNVGGARVSGITMRECTWR